jgi:hypothetical protein
MMIALTLWPAKAAPQAAEASDDPRVLGAWELACSEEEARRVVNRAVDETAGAMDWFVRGFARARLRQGTPVHRELELQQANDERLTVRFANESYTTTVGRTETRRNPAGESMRVTQRFRRNGGLEQVFATDQGTRSYVYTPLPNGGLRVTTRTESPRLPRPMVFSLEYRRAQ